MNEQLQKIARNILKEGLSKLPKSNQMIFKRMYSHKNLEADISDIIDKIPCNKLDWAMQQVERSLTKIRQQVA